MESPFWLGPLCMSLDQVRTTDGKNLKNFFLVDQACQWRFEATFKLVFLWVFFLVSLLYSLEGLFRVSNLWGDDLWETYLDGACIDLSDEVFHNVAWGLRAFTRNVNVTFLEDVRCYFLLIFELSQSDFLIFVLCKRQAVLVFANDQLLHEIVSAEILERVVTLIIHFATK